MTGHTDRREKMRRSETNVGAWTFGERSQKNLVGVHPDLILVMELGLKKSPYDFFINEGVRTEARQRALYAQGRSKPGPKVTWTLVSNHFKNKKTGYGHAVDAYKFPFSAKQTVAVSLAIAKAVLQAADELDIPVRWGGNWDMDGNYFERGEGDSPHFELWGYGR